MPRAAIASYAGAQQSAVLGLKDLLEAANAFRTSAVPDTGEIEVTILGDFATGTATRFEAVILPPCLDGPPDRDEITRTAAWIQAQHDNGALVCSICAGAFPLAQSGLLNGRPATTHWALAEELAKTFPEVHVDEEKLIIDDGDIITAGGLMAWTDLGLRLIARFLGTAVMLETARLFLIDPGEREQSYYNLFVPNLSHGDGNVLKAQHWVQANHQSSASVPDMASIAGLGNRTFLRRFRAATGHNPSDYLQRLRINKAREHLELTTNGVEAIAAEVGYMDAPTFSKLFRKVVGLSPSEYRRRFSPRRS